MLRKGGSLLSSPRGGLKGNRMDEQTVSCVLLADRHHGLSEGMRGLLESAFDAVVMVADETSLFETASRLKPSVAVVDLSLARDESIQWVSRLRARCPGVKLIVLSVHDQPSVCRAALEAGADAFVLKRALGTDLMLAIDAVQLGQTYVSPGIVDSLPPTA
jgi:two-component system secretion response regulator SsrB